MATDAERAWAAQSDEVFDVVADLDPPSARIRYAFQKGYHAAGTCPDDAEHVCANHPIHAQAKIIGQRQQIERLQNAVALLNSMVLSGEDHSETSRAVVREALG